MQIFSKSSKPNAEKSKGTSRMSKAPEFLHGTNRINELDDKSLIAHADQVTSSSIGAPTYRGAQRVGEVTKKTLK